MIYRCELCGEKLQRGEPIVYIETQTPTKGQYLTATRHLSCDAEARKQRKRGDKMGWEYHERARDSAGKFRRRVDLAERITVRCRAADAERIRAAALAQRRELSEYMVSAALAASHQGSEVITEKG